MKTLLINTFILVSLISCTNSSKKNYVDEIKLFQYKLNTEFADAKSSPLTEEDLKTFKALDFFDVDEGYNVTAKFVLTPEAPVFEMQTTTERKPLYKKYGIAKFTINGTNCELSLYQNQDFINSSTYGNLLFLPFNDLTNGKTTYGGGRFIDIEIPEKEKNTVEIDFNKSYNPYCAYNHSYSCPIPPAENNLNIDINAGEKAYHKLP
ncbi:DUF1684 domain-containing protein [Flavobacterium sp.]|uniref:DUF1684 domain-containing protein n=1 Tax=Flavobacterium sp. TaxID=239 RepID=UPI0040489209